MRRWITLITVATAVTLAACGGGGPSPEERQAAAEATRAYLDSLPELGATVTGGVDMSVNSRDATVVCTGPNGIVRDAFSISADNLTIYIPVSASPGELPVTGRNEAAAASGTSAVFEYLPTSSLFYANGGEGTFTLSSLPTRVGEFAMGEFDVTLTGGEEGEEIRLVGTFRADATLVTFNECRDQLVATPEPSS
ncbi:MAG: hypothetical protein AAF125_04265 [Chloroflexota bacterium]